MTSSVTQHKLAPLVSTESNEDDDDDVSRPLDKNDVDWTSSSNVNVNVSANQVIWSWLLRFHLFYRMYHHHQSTTSLPDQSCNWELKLKLSWTKFFVLFFVFLTKLVKFPVRSDARVKNLNLVCFSFCVFPCDTLGLNQWTQHGPSSMKLKRKFISSAHNFRFVFYKLVRFWRIEPWSCSYTVLSMLDYLLKWRTCPDFKISCTEQTKDFCFVFFIKTDLFRVLLQCRRFYWEFSNENCTTSLKSRSVWIKCFGTVYVDYLIRLYHKCTGGGQRLWHSCRLHEL